MTTRTLLIIAALLILAADARADWPGAVLAHGVAAHTYGKDRIVNKCPHGIRHDVHNGWLEADGTRALAWVDGRPCTITWSGAWLNSNAPDATSRRNKRVAACSVYVHELGHLLGYTHNDTAHAGIMQQGTRYEPCVRGLAWLEAMMKWKGYEA